MRFIFALVMWGCSGPAEPESKVKPTAERPDEPSSGAMEPVVRRITGSQYRNHLSDIFDPENTGRIVLPVKLEPDTEADGMVALGQASNALSPLGVEQYETAAFNFAASFLADDELRDGLVPCERSAVSNPNCATGFFDEVVHRLWRRDVSDEEIEALVKIADVSATTLGSFDEGLEFALAAALQAPDLVYAVESGNQQQQLLGEALVEKLSLFLWNGPPDKELLSVSESLHQQPELSNQVNRMLDDERSKRGIAAFFSQMLALDTLDSLVKDPNVFVNHSDSLGENSKEAILLLLQQWVDEEQNYRDLFTTRSTFVDRELAAIYEMPAPSPTGFALAQWPEESGRIGLLGQVGILSAQAHPVSSSVTRRGAFVRKRMLCQLIPPPPADVDTSIPEPDADAPTMRDRVAVHLEEPSCASCHQLMDPIGLALENYDGIGKFRKTENDVVIDASGSLDGTEFEDAAGLGRALSKHPRLSACLIERSFEAMHGRIPQDGQDLSLAWYEDGMDDSGGSIRALIEDMITSQAFITVSEVK